MKTPTKSAATGKRPPDVDPCYEITEPVERPLAERLPYPGQVIITSEQSAARRQVEREAMETARETGRMPRQLADERAELIAKLHELVNVVRHPKCNADARAMIAREASELLTRLNP